MQMIHIVDGPPLFTNCFLLISKEGHAVAIDPAAPAEQFNQQLKEKNAKLTHIFLTHGHHDHIGSVESLKEQHGAKVYMNEADAKHFSLKADVFYKDMDTIDIDEMQFKTIFTPGHTPGSTCLLIRDSLFSGDTLFAGSIGRTDFPGGNMDDMKKSLRKITENVPDNVKVYPGHEEFSTMAAEKAHNPYLRF